jgi:hypothetical protein
VAAGAVATAGGVLDASPQAMASPYGILVAASIALVGCSRADDDLAPPVAIGHADSLSIRHDVDYLASDRLNGRAVGEPGNDSAAFYILRRYQSLRVEPVGSGYFQDFAIAPSDSAGRLVPLRARNVIALVPGRDAKLRGEYVVVGAHYDHMSAFPRSESDIVLPGSVWNGADDNASGTAAVLALVRLLAAAPARRSLLFVNFSGEELGLFGSSYFVAHTPVPADSMVAMVNFDMVGRLRDSALIVNGVGSARELPRIVDAAARATGLRTVPASDATTASDHVPFDARGIPALHLFTGFHADYHRETDDPALVSAAGIARVVDFAAQLLRAVGDQPQRLRAQHQRRDCTGVACLRH